MSINGEGSREEKRIMYHAISWSPLSLSTPPTHEHNEASRVEKSKLGQVKRVNSIKSE